MPGAALAALLLAAAPAVTLEIIPRQATVGDPLAARLVVELPAGTTLEPGPVGPELGPDASVLEGAWQPAAGAAQAVWSGKIAAYRTGKVEIPPVAVGLRGAAGAVTVRSEPVVLEIRSVLAAGEEDPAAKAEIADLKPPASIAPDWRPLRRALGALALLLAAAAIAYALYRRYAPRFAAAPVSADPFRRLPPHVWAYEELRRLLDDRVAEELGTDRFFEELSRIVKMYLGARFRVDLMERTTAEAASALEEAGGPRDAVWRARVLLDRADRVKFAREAATLADVRHAVDEAYAIVDATKVEDAAPVEGAA